MTNPTDSFYRHLREWFTVFMPRQRGVSPHTITACRHTWNMLLRYVAETRGVPLERVTFSIIDRACIVEFLDHMRATRSWTGATYNQRLACIRSFYRYAATAESTLAIYLADVNGIPQLKIAATPTVRHLSTSAVAALLAAPDPAIKTGLRDQFFMILMYDVAARDAEMLALTVGDLDIRRLTVDLIGKGAKPRRLPITGETAAHYRRYTDAFHPDAVPGDPLFFTIHGHRKTRMSDDNVGRFVRQHASSARESCAEIPKRVHPHMLRHSRAMHLYQAGMPLALITEWLGHVDPETTLIYAHADTEMKRQALARVGGGTTGSPPAVPMWHDRDDIVRRLCGLTA